MTRSAIISCIIHLIIIIVTMNLPKNAMQKVGNIGTIEVRISSDMTGPSTETKQGNSSNPMEDNTKTRTELQAEKPLEKQKEREVKKIENLEKLEKTVKKAAEPEEVEVGKEIKPKKTKKEITKNLEKENQEKINEKIVEKNQKDKENIKDKKVIEENQEDSKKLATNTAETSEISDNKSTGDSDSKRGIEDGDLGDDLIKLSDGSIAVKHQGVKGLSYGFISNPEPSYPSRARRLGFKGDMTIRVIMQFGSSGRLENIKFVDEEDKFGFAGEVEKAIKNWRLSPITYRGRSVKMRFYKSFRFEKQG